MRDLLVAVLCGCFTILLWGSGCSKEEESRPPVQGPKVAQAIPRTAPEKAAPSLPAEDKKPSDTKEAKPPAGEDRKPVDLKGAKGTHTEEKKSPDAKQIKGKAIEEKAPKTKGPDLPKKEKAGEEVEGVYRVVKGDTLSKIAGREGLYRDPLKWAILYRLNAGDLSGLGSGEDVPTKGLPVGMALKTTTREEFKENLKKRADRLWVVNVLSATTNGEIVPPTVALIKNGYPAYITAASVKGKEYMRVRVGFFKRRIEADAAGAKIKELLKSADSWCTKVEKEELDAFGGY